MSTTNQQSDSIDVQSDETVEATMRVKWWRFARQLASVARDEIEGMSPEERDTPVTTEDCSETIEKIDESGFDEESGWMKIDLTETDRQVLWQGLVDMHFRRREQAGDNWEDVDHSPRYYGVMGTLTAFDARDDLEMNNA